MDISLENKMLKAVKDQNLDTVKSLLTKGANPNKTTSNGKSCLGEAAVRGFTEIAVLLIANSHYVSTEYSQSSDDEDNCDCTHAYSRKLKKSKEALKDKTETKPEAKVLKDNTSSEESKVAGAVALSPSSPQKDLEWDEEMANVAATTSEDESIESMYKWYANILEFTGAAIVAASDYTCGIDQLDAYGRAALSYAAEDDNVEVVKALVTAGCKVDLAEGNGLTALHVSVAGNHKEIVRVLLAAGSDVNIQTPVKTAPLHIAACYDLDMVRLIEEKGARLNIRDEKDRTALYIAAAQGHGDIVQYLIERGANCDLGDTDGHTPLCKAVLFNHYDTAKLLLESGARVTHYQCLLQVAIKKLNCRMIELLASHGCGINVHGPSGETPLLMAMALDDPFQVATILLEKGANVNTCNSQSGANALHVAVEFSEDHEDFEKLLNILLDYQIDVDKRANTQDTPLNRAILMHKDRIALQLIRYGANVNLCEMLTNVFGNLIIASNRKSNKLAQMLIIAGHYKVTLNLVNNPKETAKWITETFKSPMSLANTCRVQIRNKRNRQVNLRDYVASLPMPEAIKKFLMMEEFVC